MMSIITLLARYALYPTLLIATLATAGMAIAWHWDYGVVYGAVTVALVTLLAVTERIAVFESRWSMTWRSFLRDLKYIAAAAPTIALARTAFGTWAIVYSARHTPLLQGTPVWVEIVAFLVTFEFFQYWYHRLSHTAGGRLGEFLWRVHVAHHLPDRVYVLMHAVFHPINTLISTAIIQAPLIVLGISPEAALVATLLIDLQSLVSHFNVDVRAGWLNYVFIGTETHRYHHSADTRGNYGNTLALWDLIFSTFHYRPGLAPARLGVEDPAAYPDSNRWATVVALPFASRTPRAAHGSGEPSRAT
jgi:sterol desaturase/sphingolipid hydroxylase (fatty acid hydroxylase superfamily)